MDAIQRNLVDSYAQRLADKEYQEAVKQHEVKLRNEKNMLKEKLKDPEFAKSLGLPENLPHHTRIILKNAMAIDKIGPQQPSREFHYKNRGIM